MPAERTLPASSFASQIVLQYPGLFVQCESYSDQTYHTLSIRLPSFKDLLLILCLAHKRLGEYEHVETL